MHKSNNEVIIGCINVVIVNKYLIQKKTFTNILKFIQMLKDIKKLRTNNKNQIKNRHKNQLKKNRVNVRFNQV
jgi:hypothetical protein